MTQQTTTPLGARSTSTGQVLASLLHFLVPLAAVSGICIAAVIGIAAIKDITTFELFPTDRVLDVQITVAEKDWNKIRFQSRNFFEALQEKRKYEPIEPPYVYVTARVTVDGVEFPQVGIRKKGFIGSQNPNRPSLKIKLNHIDEKAELGGQSMLTFNNNNQDITLMSQFMGYALFNAAGATAPRCGYARISVNGKPIGLYSHVESVRKPLLKRGFQDDRGTLFEGTVVDFYEGWENSFEKKFGRKRMETVARDKIKALIQVLKRPEWITLTGLTGDRFEWTPTDAQLGQTWTANDFDDSDWNRERDDNSADEPLYFRFPFKIVDLNQAISSNKLTLNLRYGDGFIAYLNGHRVAAANAPESSTWNAGATDRREDRQSRQLELFDLSSHRDKLRAGDNVLAIHHLNIDSAVSRVPGLSGIRKRRPVFAELQYQGEDLQQAIGELVDLDSFYRFWAVEGLLGFWDGYSANNNNFFVYHNPSTDKFHFVPWGGDCMFEKYSKLPVDRRAPLSVKTKGLVAHKLYQIPEARERYARTLKTIMDEHWNEESLLAETRRLEAMLKPHLPPSQARTVKFDGIRNFIRNRRSDIENETADGMPIWTAKPSEPPILAMPGGGGRGRGPRGGRPRRNANSIFDAAKTGNLAAIKRHVARGTDIDKTDENGGTALSLATLVGKIKTARFLIEKGADVDHRNNDGNRALHGAAFLGQRDAVELLLDSGADVNARNNKGETPLDTSAAEWNDEIQGFVQFIAGALQIDIDIDEVRTGRPGVATLLRERGGRHGGEVAATSNVDIWKAARSGNLDALKQKLAARTDINGLDGKGVSPLSWAAMSGQVEAVKLLIRSGADINRKNRDGNTPLHGAAFLGHADIVALLIENKVEVNARNGQDETALGTVAPEWNAGVRRVTQFFARILQLEIDIEAIKAARPRIAERLRQHGGKTSEQLK